MPEKSEVVAIHDALHAGGAVAISTGGRSLQEMKDWLGQLREFVRSILVPGVDFGTIPGAKKPFLQKPGAEKLCLLYNLAPEFHPIDSDTIRDWTTNPPHIQLAYRCDLIHRPTGTKVGEGSGVCSSWEQKYRYRAEWWNEKGEPPVGAGWKKTKTGYRRQTVNEDISDSINTILKIAQKRAQIDAVLRSTATSEFFVQDIEDAPPPVDEGPPAEDAAIEKKVGEVVTSIETAATPEALQTLATEIGKLGKPIAKHARVRAAYKKRHHELKPDAGATEAPKSASPAKPMGDAGPATDGEDPQFSDPGPSEDD